MCSSRATGHPLAGHRRAPRPSWSRLGIDHVLNHPLVHRAHALDAQPLVDAARVKGVTARKPAHHITSHNGLHTNAARRRAVRTNATLPTFSYRRSRQHGQHLGRARPSPTAGRVVQPQKRRIFILALLHKRRPPALPAAATAAIATAAATTTTNVTIAGVTVATVAGVTMTTIAGVAVATIAGATVAIIAIVTMAVAANQSVLNGNGQCTVERRSQVPWPRNTASPRGTQREARVPCCRCRAPIPLTSPGEAPPRGRIRPPPPRRYRRWVDAVTTPTGSPSHLPGGVTATPGSNRRHRLGLKGTSHRLISRHLPCCGRGRCRAPVRRPERGRPPSSGRTWRGTNPTKSVVVPRGGRQRGGR